MRNVIVVKQLSLDSWNVRHLQNLLKKAARTAQITGEPVILYRQVIEEENDSYEEMICTLCAGFVVEQIVISGGPLPPSIKRQTVSTLEQYPQDLIKESKERFQETVRHLEEKLK